LSALRRRLGASLVAVGLVGVVAVAVPACGSADEAAIASTVERFYSAASEGDGEAACRQLTPAARAPVSGLDCESSINQLGQLGGGTAERRLASVEVSDVRVRGDNATARARIPTQTPMTLQLEKVRERTFKWKNDEEWRISSLGAGVGGGF
jgi:hypothetical protein